MYRLGSIPGHNHPKDGQPSTFVLLCWACKSCLHGMRSLAGYLSGLIPEGSEPTLAKVKESGWPASVHIIGKDILRFHAIYWPGMLLSADLPLPKQVYGHGFLTKNGMKMGKALGNTLDPK
eukprot:scaffold283225_cov19-Tisochrysis_lutea.AAC.2